MTSPINWNSTKLIAFDVDGTLYRQFPVRLRMSLELAHNVLKERHFQTIRVLKTFRELREKHAETETEAFQTLLFQETATTNGCSVRDVKNLVMDWIEQRPLRHLSAARYSGLDALFKAIKNKGKKIGILSDYASSAKLKALNLDADFIVSAEDALVDRLKPHPLGLQTLMSLAGVSPNETCLIGDRIERDGMAARRAGAACLIRSSKKHAGWTTFSHYNDQIFRDLLI